MTVLLIASLLLNIFLAFCGYYLSSELMKKEIDKKKEKEVFEKLELDNTLEKLRLTTEEIVNSLSETISKVADELMKGERE